MSAATAAVISLTSGKDRSHYPERASVSDFQDVASLRFVHSDVAFYLFMEIRFFLFNYPLIQLF